jgi:hypothetical protein
VIPGECVVSQHKLVVVGSRFLVRARRVKQAKIARTKWWKLEGEASKVFKERVIEEGPWKDEGDANNMWEKMATCIWKVAAEVLGVTKGSGCDLKDAWWWNEDVQKAIKEKKECYKHLYQDRCADNIEKYKVARKTAKRAVGEAKGQAYEGLYQRLNTKEGEKDIYRMARARDRKTRDFNQVKCIKDQREQLLVKEDEIRHRWQEYFDKLFNAENENSIVRLEDLFEDTNRRFVRRIQV